MSVTYINSANEFAELLSSSMYVVVDFKADWCAPCRQISPIVAKMAEKHYLSGYLAFAAVDVDKVKDVAAQYGISAMPTFMFFKEGKQVGVNGHPLIRGADPRSLNAAVEKLSGLAITKKATADEKK